MYFFILASYILFWLFIEYDDIIIYIDPIIFRILTEGEHAPPPSSPSVGLGLTHVLKLHLFKIKQLFESMKGCTIFMKRYIYIQLYRYAGNYIFLRYIVIFRNI